MHTKGHTAQNTNENLAVLEGMATTPRQPVQIHQGEAEKLLILPPYVGSEQSR